MTRDAYWRAANDTSVCIEGRVSVLLPGEERVVPLAPRVPIGHSVNRTDRAPANPA